MTTQQINASEMVQSLTGFEEIAVEKHMGIDVYMDGETKPIKVLRAMVFVLKTRDGMDPKSAKQIAQEMPMGEVQDMFEDEIEEDPEDPISVSGKDSAPSE